MIKYNFITNFYYSNCLIEALKAKIKNKSIKIYYCKPSLKKHQMAHFMWTDGIQDYDFSDKESDHLSWYNCLWFKGAIRSFPLGFAKKYSQLRNNQ